MNENDAQFDPAASGDELMELAVFHLEGRLSGPQRTRLNTLLAEDAGNRETFVAVCTQATLLASCAGFDVEPGDGFAPAAEAAGPPPSALPFATPPLTTSHYPLATNFVGSGVFSYMVATVILGVMLLGAWAFRVSHYRPQMVGTPSWENPSSNTPEMAFVGRITGMKDCRWSDTETQTYIGSSVPLGRKYALSAGLMEITYDTGAKVILEGPCTYKVESDAGGYLELGKLTAHIVSTGLAASAASGMRSEVGGRNPRPKTQDQRPQSEIPQISKSPNL